MPDAVAADSMERRSHSPAESAAPHGERALSDHDYERALQEVPMGVCSVLGDGNVTWVNACFLRMHGAETAADLRQSAPHLRLLFRARGREWDPGLLNGTVHPDGCDAELRREDGTWLPVRIRIRAADPADARSRRLHLFVEETATQKSFESILAQLQEVEAIGTAARGISHTLKNVLSPIILGVRLLHQELAADQRGIILANIESSAERAARLVRRILGSPESSAVVAIRLDIAEIMEDIAAIISRSSAPVISVSCSMEANLREAIGDAARLHAAITSLCLVSRDAMPEGGKLSLHAGNVDIDPSSASMIGDIRPGPYVLIELRDSGRMVPANGSSRGNGSPLSLSALRTASARAVFHEAGGALIERHSENGSASTRLYLPAAAPQRAPRHELRSYASSESELILIVEDELSVGSAAQTVLELYGYKVIRASDGTEALALYAQNPRTIRAVVTDVVMPYMDGITLIRALRRLDNRVPIIASTAHGRLAELEALEVHSVLHKPYDAGTLLATLHTALNRAGGTQSPDRSTPPL